MEESAPNCHNIHLPPLLSVCMHTCVCVREKVRDHRCIGSVASKDNKIGCLHGKTEIREGVGRTTARLELRVRLIIYLFATVSSQTSLLFFFSLVA